MNYKLGIRNLGRDILENKQIALFLGAGVNNSDGVHLLWDELISPILKSALYRVSMDYSFSYKQLDELLDLFEIQPLNDIENEPQYRALRKKAVSEYNPTVKAMLVKAVLGKQYIPAFREQIYSQCNRTILRDALVSNYVLDANEEYKQAGAFYTLYTIARLVLLNPNVKAVVTYNYDNFLTHIINIMQDNPERYFCKRDIDSERTRLTLDKQKRLKVKDIYGLSRPDYLDSDTLFIYHPHGYIPAPHENVNIDNCSIIMSQDEYCENTTKVYSWDNDTQVHLLSHYTCIFIGSSISELTTQRMIHYARNNGNKNSLYYLGATDKQDWPDSPLSSEASECLSALKSKYYEICGLSPVICPQGFAELFHNINDIIEKRITQKD